MRNLLRLLTLGLLLGLSGAASAQLLPNGQQQFLDSNGQPLAGGSVYFYTPGTTSPKFTFQNPGMTTANTNPVVLNSAGRAVIWGSGLYREVVYDSTGALVWDQLTAGQGSLPVGTKITGTTSIATCSYLFPVVPSAPVTLTFPGVPNTGDTCTVADAGNTAGTFPITSNFGANHTNQGGTTDIISVNGGVRTYVWLGSPAVWQVMDESPLQATAGGYYAVDSGSVNALAVTLSPAPVNQAALVGVPIRIMVSNTNTVNVPTLNVNAFGAHNIVSLGPVCTAYLVTCTNNTAANVIGVATLVAGRIIEVVWDGTSYQFQQPFVNATPAQIQAGTDLLSPLTSLAFAQAQPASFGTTTGRQVFANGMMVQWGVYVPATGNQDIFNFPASFSTHGVSIVANVFNGASNVDLTTISFNNNGQGIVSVWEWNGSTFVNKAGNSIHWMAIGY